MGSFLSSRHDVADLIADGCLESTETEGNLIPTLSCQKIQSVDID